MSSSEPLSFVECFRHWYDYERHCNARTLEMLESVSPANRASPEFGRAVGKMAHLVAARHFWLRRLGRCTDRPESWFPDIPLHQLPERLADIERRWSAYLAGLTESDLAGDCVLTLEDGRRWRWRLVDLLTQLFGHAWYHRGQVAMLVKDLGGQPVNTDYIFWSGPTLLNTTE
ncbi:MAG: hypothetical protein L0Y42_09960 [Phycisphaerales bacterium]|nr:hypothetical protein [Phycisphaerales bacterium]